jgi:hypothetical protein
MWFYVGEMKGDYQTSGITMSDGGFVCKCFLFQIKLQVVELKTRRFTESSMCLFSIMSLGVLLEGVVIPDPLLVGLLYG